MMIIKKGNNKVKIDQMKLALSAIYTVAVIVLSQNCYAQQSPDELKTELLKEENANPTTYLKIIKHDNIQHHVDGWFVSGYIKNTATLAYFKDAVVIVSYYTQSQKHLISQQYVIHQSFKPNKPQYFLFKVSAPKETASIKMTIKSATAVDDSTEVSHN
jgi:hypothetical protein